MAKKAPSKAKKIITTLITLAVIAGVIGGIYTVWKVLSNTEYNDNPNANGNTPGNLYNGGLFAETDGKVFFSNPLDKGCLYGMNEDETVATKLSEETVFSLNAYGSYIYYCKNNLNDSNSTSILRGSLLGAARCDLDGKGVVELNNKYTGTIVLVGNDTYFEHYTNDHKNSETSYSIKTIGIQGGESKEFSKDGIPLACTVGSTVYYAGTENDHNIYSMSLRSKAVSTIVEGNCWMPIVTAKGDLYYLDLEDNYSLIKTNVNNTENKTVLVDERISSYNVSDTYIYFQIDDKENSKLCRIRKDASTNEYEVVSEGNYENINITSKYVYFNTLGHKEQTYRTPVNAPVRVTSLSESVEFKDKK